MALREGAVLHFVDGWHNLNPATTGIELAQSPTAGVPEFDRDIYAILTRAINKLKLVGL